MSGNRNGRASRNGRMDMTLLGISDFEVLAIVDDLAHESDGWATTYDVRLRLGENVESPARTGVGIRLAWLRRYGWLEKGEAYRDNAGTWMQPWRLTRAGEGLIDHPDLTRAASRAFDGLNTAQRLQLVRQMGEQGYGQSAEVRAALRRQWQRSMIGGALGQRRTR